MAVTEALPVRGKLRAYGTIALRDLRERWRLLTFVVLLAAMSLGVVTAARSLAVVSFPVIAFDPDALVVGREVISPSRIQEMAVGDLLGIIVNLGWIAVVVTMITVIALFALEAHGRAAELAIRRALGASLRTSIAAFLGESLLLAAAAVAIGVVLSAGVLLIALHFWPAVRSTPVLSPGLPMLALAVSLCVAGLIPVLLVRGEHLREAPEREVGFKTPALQLAASISLFIFAVSVLHSFSPGSVALHTAQSDIVADVDSGITDPAQRAVAYRSLMRLSSAFGDRYARSFNGTRDCCTDNLRLRNVLHGESRDALAARSSDAVLNGR
jgi:hypothetical protein